jgi:adenylate cyclase class 2
MQTSNNREIEIKLFLIHPEELVKKLEKVKAQIVQSRVNEWNLRFDTLNNGLSATGQVLRLRKDERSRLTYKSEASLNEDVTDRQELEVEVSDFDTTRKILEVLGFSVFVMYEKFRTTWHWLDCEVTLDEMPYGFFCEVEGHDPVRIRNVVERLGLDWNQRILTSYLGLFTMLKNIGKLKAENLIFSAFAKEKITPEDFADLNIHPADII